MSLSRQTTLNEQDLAKPSAQLRADTHDERPTAYLRPDPPPPKASVQFMRWLKLHLKASVKPGSREYNPHSGF